MVTSLKEIDSFVSDPVNQSVFLADPPRPATGQHITERLGFAHALKRISHHRFDKIEYSHRGAPVGLDPVPQVVTKLSMENSNSFSLVAH